MLGFREHIDFPCNENRSRLALRSFAYQSSEIKRDESCGTADKAFELKGIERKRPSVTKGAPSPHFGIGTSRQRKFHFPELTDFSATIPRNHLHLS
jgi:hypothetical protein